MGQLRELEVHARLTRHSVRGVRTLDALHLAAVDRLPRPLAILTFDRRQAEIARSMALVVEGV